MVLPPTASFMTYINVVRCHFANLREFSAERTHIYGFWPKTHKILTVVNVVIFKIIPNDYSSIILWFYLKWHNMRVVAIVIPARFLCWARFTENNHFSLSVHLAGFSVEQHSIILLFVFFIQWVVGINWRNITSDIENYRRVTKYSKVGSNIRNLEVLNFHHFRVFFSLSISPSVCLSVCQSVLSSYNI